MNHSPDETRFADFISNSLATLRSEHPAAYFLMCGLLAPREVLIRVDGEAVSLAFRPQGVTTSLEASRPSVLVRTSRKTILDLIEGHETLDGAVLAETMTLQGSLRDVADFHESLLTYVMGAVRCPSFPELLTRFRAAPNGATSSPPPARSRATAPPSSSGQSQPTERVS